MVDIFDDLESEEARLESILASLDETAWTSASGAPGWSISDVVLHLAQSEEAVVASASAGGEMTRFDRSEEDLDEVMEQWVRAERAEPSAVFERWRSARRASLEALRRADPATALRWAETPLKPRALATTRIAEHWAHGLDITGSLDIDFPDTDRLRHVAWLAHRTLPYAFALEGEEAHEVFCELEGPGGDVWHYGPPGATSRIVGAAGAFCRVGARRLAPEASGLSTHGPFAGAALSVLRNYAA